MVFLPALCTSQDTHTYSRATYYGSPDYLGTPTGACGYGEFGRNINGGSVGAVARLYRNGTGCGACYQVRCTIHELCTEDGVHIVVTDHGESDNTDFILSTRAYTKLARSNRGPELLALGVVDIEFKRISCRYPGYNLMFKVHEHSKYPHYLALVIIYQAGQKDVTAVELWREDHREWRGMRRAYGAVWDMPNPPQGAIKLRFQLNAAAWVQVDNAVPSDWKAGAAYESAIQLN